MASESKKKTEEQAPESEKTKMDAIRERPVVGRTFRGQGTYPIKTEEEAVQEMNDMQAARNDPDMMDLEGYLSVRGVRDFPTRAAMAAFTKTVQATRKAWDEIFSGF